MAHAIEVRKIPFEFTDGPNAPTSTTTAASNWNPTQLEWNHMMNGASLTMPYLEPFLNRTMREALADIMDADLREDIDGFIRQEAQHYKNHRRYNEVLKADGYSELADVEATFEADYAALEKRSLPWRLAYAAGFETMTMGVTEWLVNDRESLFHGADPMFTSFILWHMVEETEHKSVAYDVFQKLSGRYWLRIAGLIWGSLHVGLMSRRAYIVMLKKDGRWNDLRTRFRLYKMISRFFLRAGVAMVRALNPGYHPDKVKDPAWVHQWRAAYADQGKNFVPMLNTMTKGIPPEFAQTS